MPLLSDKWIKKTTKLGMIKPFVGKQVRKENLFGCPRMGMMQEYLMNLKSLPM